MSSFTIGLRHFLASIDVNPNSSHIEKERPMRVDAKNCLKPIVKELIDNGILKIADTQGKFLSNSHGVAKPINGERVCGKADEYLMKKKGLISDYSRLTVDLRGLNSHCPSSPKLSLPSYETLVKKFKNKFVSMFDIRSMYWSICITHESQELTNFFFDRHVLAFRRLPMGYKNSCFIGQSASEMTYSQESLLRFLKLKGWELNSENFPFADISDIIIIYSDDICVFSPDNIDNAENIHLRWEKQRGTLK